MNQPSEVSQAEVPHGWTLIETGDQPRLERCFIFEDFAEAFRFADLVKDLAELENHHPHLIIQWGQIQVSWWSHDTGGVSRRDLRLAKLTNQLLE